MTQRNELEDAGLFSLTSSCCTSLEHESNVAIALWKPNGGAERNPAELMENAFIALAKAFPFSLPYDPQFLILIPYAGPRNSRSAGPQFPIARHATPGSFLTGPGAAQFLIEIPIRISTTQFLIENPVFLSSYIWASWSIFELYLGVLVEF